MADQFIGVCVGGPMAGQMIAQQRQSFDVNEQKRPSGDIVNHEYRWHSLGPFAIWIHESLDFNHALAAVVEAYAEKHHAA